MSDLGNGSAIGRLGWRVSSGTCGPLTSARMRGRVVETEQVVRIVDQHVELLEKILAENALNVEAGGLEILEVIHQHLLVGDGVRAGFEPVEMGEGSGGLGTDACDLGLPLGGEMEFGGQGGIDHRDLRAGVEEEAVGAGVVDGDGDNHVVVD